MFCSIGLTSAFSWNKTLFSTNQNFNHWRLAKRQFSLIIKLFWCYVLVTGVYSCVCFSVCVTARSESLDCGGPAAGPEGDFSSQSSAQRADKAA